MTVWRCQCPLLCEEGESCWSDVTQEDFLCDWCRAICKGKIIPWLEGRSEART